MDRSRYALLILLMVFTAPAVSELPDYPEAEVESKSEDTTEISRRLILSSLKKINNVLAPEKVEYVKGTRESLTLYIPNERRTEVVLDFYRDHLLRQGTILYECHGRECGSSNYWANTVFSTSILYGPEQYQHYVLAQLDGSGDYIALYVAMRGTRKIYVHIETTRPSVTVTTRDTQANQGRFVFTDNNRTEIISTIARLLAEDEGLKLHLVVHQGLLPGQEVTDVVSQTQKIGEQIKLDAASGGIPGDRITVNGIGPLAPDSEYGTNRIEILAPVRSVADSQ
ncbi:MAG: DUF4892 domain-containing protein [Gammaproteobacteria bacterium]|nr:DUF4892 domain-containing protein [Gammaproteobacteria bacterium]